MYMDKTHQNIQIIKQVFLSKDGTMLPKQKTVPTTIQFHMTNLSAMFLLS